MASSTKTCNICELQHTQLETSDMQYVTYILTPNNPRFIILYPTENLQNKADSVYTPNLSAFLENSLSFVSIDRF
jgi:hypothetical protein